jgi:hypothetical protein
MLNGNHHNANNRFLTVSWLLRAKLKKNKAHQIFFPKKVELTYFFQPSPPSFPENTATFFPLFPTFSSSYAASTNSTASP